MVNKISKFTAYTLFFLLALMYFTPKLSLYYFVEHQIKKYGVIIDDEVVVDNGLSLSIYDAKVNVKSIESVKIKDTQIQLFGFFNSVSLRGLELSSVAASLVPTKVESVDISYNIFQPLNLNAQAVGEFGEADASFDFLDFAIHLELHPSQKMLRDYRQTLSNLKKSKEGVYTYDKTIKH